MTELENQPLVLASIDFCFSDIVSPEQYVLKEQVSDYTSNANLPPNIKGALFYMLVSKDKHSSRTVGSIAREGELNVPEGIILTTRAELGIEPYKPLASTDILRRTLVLAQYAIKAGSIIDHAELLPRSLGYKRGLKGPRHVIQLAEVLKTQFA